MSKIIGWAANVNKRILDSTSITIGDKGYVEDSGDSGAFTERRLTSLFSPDTYNVTMDFDWLEKDSEGKSELDRFVEWYKYRHKRGTNPFEFPSISNFTDILGSVRTSYYRITGNPSMSKSGYCMRVQMTWTEHYEGVINIPDMEPSITGVSCTQSDGYAMGKFTISFSQALDTLPLSTDYQIYYARLTGGDYESELSSSSFIRLPTNQPESPLLRVQDTPVHDVVYRFTKLPRGVYLMCVNGEYTTPQMRCIMRVTE